MGVLLVSNVFAMLWRGSVPSARSWARCANLKRGLFFSLSSSSISLGKTVEMICQDRLGTKRKRI